MEKVLFSQAHFIASAFEEDQFPQLRDARGADLPEIAFVGRSNVGKSSLINSLLKKQKLAKTSSTPGKTQSINFYAVDQRLLLVDLPGYGYARVPKATKEKWSHLIDAYLEQRPQLRLILFLLDARREPTEQDRTFMQWAAHRRIPLLLILTKADKLANQEHLMDKKTLLGELPYLYYSVKDARSRVHLIQQINFFFT
ncbi:MAG TPA: ribosome biogenesis GTP-binding protein YihA/YsxC [Rhabdochlamydiaceae bacterium]|jgi:GTP-binding protein